MKVAKYECLACGHRFGWMQGVKALPPSGCPHCQHEYLKWLNYEEDFVRGIKS